MVKTPYCLPVVAAIFLTSLPVTLADSVARPNMLIIMCDDLGYADVGFNGAPDIRTPELDKLANAGTICTSGYVTHPFCGPSRMGLLSGRYPHQFGGQFNLPPTQVGLTEYNKLGIPESETLISSVLQDAGYFTGCVGKWHLGEDEKYHPNNRGFEDFYGFLGGGHNYFPQQYAPAYQRQKAAGKKLIHDYLAPLEHNGQPTTEDGYLTDELSEHAVTFIRQAAEKRDQPFFLYLSYNAPHAPMEAKEEDLAQYAHISNPKRRVVAGMVAAVDRGVGMVADALRETDQFENTLLIFLSDNGGKPSLGSSNTPLRGTKGDTWEGGFRVPMFWHWPARLPAQKYDHPVSALDFYPTFAALAGADVPKSQSLDGIDMMNDLISGSDARSDSMIFAMRHRNSYSDISARHGDWKVARFGRQPWRLFNITEDPGETKDLATQNRSQVEKMVRAAKRWSDSHTQPLWFHAAGARDIWAEQSMPKFDREFQPETGAPALPPAVHITDSASPSVPNTSLTVKLKKGDSTLEHFLSVRKAQAEKNGQKFDRAGAVRMFNQMDDDRNGVVSGAEKKKYWARQ